MKQVTAYACEFCPSSKLKIYLFKSSAQRHEKKCFLNPENRACASCKHNFRNIEDEVCFLNFHDAATPSNPTGLRKNCPMWMPKEEVVYAPVIWSSEE